MSWDEFWVILAVCGACMLVCRVLPLFLLKEIGRASCRERV